MYATTASSFYPRIYCAEAETSSSQETVQQTLGTLLRFLEVKDTEFKFDLRPGRKKHVGKERALWELKLCSTRAFPFFQAAFVHQNR